jgi:hypothetical protein
VEVKGVFRLREVSIRNLALRGANPEFAAGFGAKVYADLRAAGNDELRRKGGCQFKLARQQHNSCLSPSGEAILTFGHEKENVHNVFSF